MSYEFDTSAAVFDRADLRVLRASYARALSELEVTRIMDASAKGELAKLIFHLGRGRICDGTGLRERDADVGIAGEAGGFLGEVQALALCA